MDKKLTAADLKHLERPGKYLLGQGLYFRIAPGGSRQWFVRISVDGKRRELGLGGYPRVTLTEARALAERIRVQNRAGKIESPRKRTTIPTYAEIAEMVEARESGERSASTMRAWRRSQDAYALPALGGTRIDRIDRNDVLAVLLPIHKARPSTAIKVRSNMRAVFDEATMRGYRDDNPAGAAIAPAFKNGKAKVKHHRHIDHAEMPALLRDVSSAHNIALASRLVIRFAALTAVRSAEARGARWNEIDGSVWTIPGERMKGRNAGDHRVPLSAAALAVLSEARAIDDGSGLIFPSPTKAGQALHVSAPMAALKAVGWHERTDLHGLRSTFRAWATDLHGAAWDTVEAALAHVVGNAVSRSYDHSDRMAARVDLMEAWGAYAIGA